MYKIEYTPLAKEDLKWFEKREQRAIIDAVDLQLLHQPKGETRNRKQMRPNSTAEWELRIGKFRVFYNVHEEMSLVEIQRVGEKRGSTFVFRGTEEDV
jgi:mRNA-degrading endonuclease RelE of RelBE toxin-antitoxin system